MDVHASALLPRSGATGIVLADLRESGAILATRNPFAGGDMRLDFVGVDPNNPSDDCPAVFVDSETGDFYMQGETVTDPDVLAWINSDSRIQDSESVVMLPARMAAIILEAANGGYERGRRRFSAGRASQARRGRTLPARRNRHSLS